MFSPVWHIGLDIQNHALRAVALQRRRYGWQLRQWWQHPLSDAIFLDENLSQPEQVIQVIQRWRHAWPRKISVRIALPATQVIQRCLELPDPTLKGEALQWYVSAQLASFLPEGERAMRVDYRQCSSEPTCLYVTVVRKKEADNWLACLSAAGLTPQIMEITPTVLRAVAQSSGVEGCALLVHRVDTHLLWVSPLDHPLRFGVLPVCTQNVGELARQAYVDSSQRAPSSVCYSSVVESDQPAGCLTFSPFKAIQQLSPPLPKWSSAFTLAVGLALRDEDHLVCR